MFIQPVHKQNTTVYHKLTTGNFAYSGNFFFGRNAFSLFSSVVKKEPPINSIQYGIAGMTASIHSLIAFGLRAN